VIGAPDRLQHRIEMVGDFRMVDHDLLSPDPSEQHQLAPRGVCRCGWLCSSSGVVGHDPGQVIRDLAVMLADGGECVSDLGAVRDQEALFGPVASDSTAFRVIDHVASEPGRLEALRSAHTRARAVTLARLLHDPG
jgi:hypothetical protein